MNFSDQNLFVVRCCCRCCRWHKPFTFSSSSPEPQGQFQWIRIQVCSNEGPHPFPREDNYKIAKMHWLKLRILFSRTTGPISTKLCTMPPWVMGIKVYSNEGSHPFPRGYNYEIAKKKLWQIFKNLFLENHWANFNQTWHNVTICERDSSFFKWRTI